jgi:hypothetical protein
MKNVSPLQKKRLMARSRHSVDNEPKQIIKTGEAINGAVTWQWAEVSVQRMSAYNWCKETFGEEGYWYNDDGARQSARWLSTSHVFYFSDSTDRLAFILRWS